MEYETSFSTGGTSFGGGDSSGWLFGNYAQARYSLPRRWLVELGVRADAYNPGVGNIVFEPSPRLALKRFYRNGDLAAKVAAGRYTQFVHSLRDEELPLGLDIWIISDENVPHTVSDQVQFGLEGWHDIDWFWSIEGYYRSFNGVVTFNTADNPNDPTDDILGGRGTSWGADVMIRKETGEVNGWLAVSFLKAQRLSLIHI